MVTMLAREIADQIRGERFMLGICGPPGAGKSTLAAALSAELNTIRPNSTVIVPMDGFHLSNEQLAEQGLLPLKGIPQTFEADGYVALLRQLRQQSAETIRCPAFDRTIESTVADAIAVTPTHQIVITEGNYLLLDTSPWRTIRTVCDQIWYVDVPLETLYPRLLSRHIAGGKNQAEAAAKVASTDFPNAQLVAATKWAADRLIEQ